MGTIGRYCLGLGKPGSNISARRLPVCNIFANCFSVFPFSQKGQRKSESVLYLFHPSHLLYFLSQYSAPLSVSSSLESFLKPKAISSDLICWPMVSLYGKSSGSSWRLSGIFQKLLYLNPPFLPPTTHTFCPEDHPYQFFPGNVNVPEAFVYPSNYFNIISPRGGGVNDVTFRHLGEVFGNGEALPFFSYHST